MENKSCLREGTLLQGGKYRIVRFLGAGGFGCTYEAVFEAMGERVAIKEFFPHELCNRDATGRMSVGTDSQVGFVERLRRKFVDEARTLFRFKGLDGVVKVTDLFEENGTSYYVMDYIEGSSLRKAVSDRGSLPEAEAIRLITEVGRALEGVHAQNCLHLDIKPDNIMLGPDGHPILIDFGVSKQYTREEGCNTSTLMGCTPGYAPLEQMKGNVRSFYPATDIYALGATLYNLVTGQTPPDATDLLNDPDALAFPDGVSAQTRAAIAAALEPKVKDRPATVAAFLSMLPGGSQNFGQEHGGEFFGQEHRRNSSHPADTQRLGQERSGKFFRREHSGEFFGQEHSRNSSHPATQLAGDRKDGGMKKYLVVAVAAAVAAIAVVVGWKLFNRPTPPPADNPIALTDSIASPADTVAPIQNAIAQAAEPQPVEPEPAKPEPKPEPTPAPAKPAVSFSVNGDTYTLNGVTFKMIPVAGGSFMMGSNDGSPCEKPVHSVTVSPFHIGQTEVTQALWQAVMGSNPSYFKGDNLPVENVSWNDCQTFIRKLNELTGMRFRLPTEAEWEYAARGGRRSNGYECSGSDKNNLGSVAWYDANSGNKTHPVAQKQPNELGIYDMSGNVWEWCSDWSSSDYYSQSEGSTNPKGPSSGSNRVDRGGGWYNSASYCRSAYRDYNSPGYRNDYLGLRLAL